MARRVGRALDGAPRRRVRPERRERGVLRDTRRTDENRVLDLVDRLCAQPGSLCSRPPARHAVALGEREERIVFRRHPEAPGEKCSLAVREVLVGLVVDVEDAAVAAERVQRAQIGFRIDRAGRIVGRTVTTARVRGVIAAAMARGRLILAVVGTATALRSPSPRPSRD